MTNTVSILRDVNPDVVVGCVYSPQLQQWSLTEMQRLNWAPKMMAYTPDTPLYWEPIVRSLELWFCFSRKKLTDCEL